ncbi:MAG TPA: hypothetical protein VJC39_03910 [Candidatus Nanoarchaeia archaeon]|nr:hypothetical protein [Candidatus Nanoarchaeia archaeon]
MSALTNLEELKGYFRSGTFVLTEDRLSTDGRGAVLNVLHQAGFLDESVGINDGIFGHDLTTNLRRGDSDHVSHSYYVHDQRDPQSQIQFMVGNALIIYDVCKLVLDAGLCVNIPNTNPWLSSFSLFKKENGLYVLKKITALF